MTVRRTPRARAQVGLTLVAASVMAAPPARAELNLQWDAPPGCPRGSEVLDRIRRLAGSSLDRTEGLSAEGRITPANGRFHLTLLVHAGVGALTARGFGTGVSSASRQAVWAAPGAGASAQWYALKSLGLFGGVSGYLELARPRLVIEGLGEVRELAPVAAGVSVGVEWIL